MRVGEREGLAFEHSTLQPAVPVGSSCVALEGFRCSKECDRSPDGSRSDVYLHPYQKLSGHVPCPTGAAMQSASRPLMARSNSL